MALACEAKANLHPLAFYTSELTSPDEYTPLTGAAAYATCCELTASTFPRRFLISELVFKKKDVYENRKTTSSNSFVRSRCCFSRPDLSKLPDFSAIEVRPGGRGEWPGRFITWENKLRLDMSTSGSAIFDTEADKAYHLMIFPEKTVCIEMPLQKSQAHAKPFTDGI